MNELATYHENIGELAQDFTSQIYEPFSGSKKDEVISVTFHLSQIKSLRNLISEFNLYQCKKEEYFVKAIKNLIIKNNFLELSLELSENQITEDEYCKEIEDHPEKFVIDIEKINDASTIGIINDIIKKIGVEFTIDEVSEIFSVDSNELEENIIKIKK